MIGQRGQGMVEYALILVLVSVVVVAVLTALGAEIKTVFTHVIQALGG
jgi:pilus assembly protein Flp/PilA